jgi:hypothetical protein
LTRNILVDFVEPKQQEESKADVDSIWGECASEFIGGLLAEAVDEFSDYAARVVEDLSNEAFVVHGVPEPSIPEEPSEFMQLLLAEEEAMRLEEAAMTAKVDDTETASCCWDYPDSELVEEDNTAAQPALQFQNMLFGDYVSDMFELAFRGGVLEFFGSERTVNAMETAMSLEGIERRSVDAATEKLPAATSLPSCSRPSFRKRLRPFDLPPQEEEFPMDCLPSAPVCSSAPQGPSLEFWAEQLQHAALTEEVCRRSFARTLLNAEAPLDNSFVQEEQIIVPVAPSADKPEGRPRTRPRPGLKTQQAPLPPTPRPPSAPRFRRAGIGASLPFSSAEWQPETGSSQQFMIAPPPKSMEQAISTRASCASMSTSITAPTAPSGPPPGGKSNRPRPHWAPSQTEATVTDKSAGVVPKAVKSSRTHQDEWVAALYKTLNLDPTGKPLPSLPQSAMAMDLITDAAPPKSAMAMDLGMELPVSKSAMAMNVEKEVLVFKSVKAMDLEKQVLVFKSAMAMDLGKESAAWGVDKSPRSTGTVSFSSKGGLHAGRTKSSQGGLPKMLRPSWGGFKTPRKAHDVI